MVAVALVPPLATAGLLLGQGEIGLALGAILQVSVNFAAISFAAHVTLYFDGIAPRTMLAAGEAKRNSLKYAAYWAVILIGLIVLATGT